MNTTISQNNTSHTFEELGSDPIGVDPETLAIVFDSALTDAEQVGVDSQALRTAVLTFRFSYTLAMQILNRAMLELPHVQEALDTYAEDDINTVRNLRTITEENDTHMDRSICVA